jgi:hypothetical protein
LVELEVEFRGKHRGYSINLEGWGLSKIIFQILGASLEISGLVVDFEKAEGSFCKVARISGFH